MIPSPSTLPHTLSIAAARCPIPTPGCAAQVPPARAQHIETEFTEESSGYQCTGRQLSQELPASHSYPSIAAAWARFRQRVTRVQSPSQQLRLHIVPPFGYPTAYKPYWPIARTEFDD
ncbi:unnamed protein product [Rhizoctonia solani]|uniref:Uncharacterized protein n=1 Tax=Rhizoctonia solani TaxID=456999 RepID=A0A8H3HWN3_9AGAM|nr:unnamed protein product [Rhizoctonia solani]